jgi:glycosyltransferase involved in cell wall biosynthesis
LRHRLRVAIQVDFSDSWMGGLNYFKNLIEAVYEFFADEVEFVVLTGTKSDMELRLRFPVVEVVSNRIFDRFSLPWIARKLTQKYCLADPILRSLLNRYRIDVLSHSGYLGKSAPIPAVSWVPDFQHLHLPQFFRRWDIQRRTAEIARIAQASTRIIVSSQSAFNDLIQIDPNARSKSDVLRFLGPRPTNQPLKDLKQLQQKYGFSGAFFYLPNQYWMHKNHLTVIRALACLRETGRSVLVLSTGKTEDFRDKGFFPSLVSEIARLGVASEYLILGVVPYDEVVSLLHHCLCLINPSHFEGWSTTVEEAKSFSKPMLLSDIPVHREQAEGIARFFDRDDAQQLAELMWEQWNSTTKQCIPDAKAAEQAYMEKRAAFARSYLEILRRTREDHGRP